METSVTGTDNENELPETSPGTNVEPDTLLDCLAILTRLHQKPFSAESLTAGLPLVNGRLTPDLFIRAAERAGFIAALVQRDIEAIADEVLPAVLILDDGHACILTAIADQSAQLIFPASGTEPSNLSVTDLNARYSGQALYFKSAYRAAGTGSDVEKPAAWFWPVIRRSRGIYGEVLIASLLVNLFALVTPLFIMNVYDRVVPNQALSTLWVLSSGVFIVLLFDLTMKSLRGYFIDVAGKRADILLSSKTFSRVMDIQMHARPTSVGSFANNLQEFDSFREFFTSTTLVTLIDLPFTILFLVLIYGIGGQVAMVPLLSIPLILTIGLLIQGPRGSLVQQVFSESAAKHAMLIETLSSLDTVKGVRAEGVMQQKWEGFNARLAKLGLRTRILSLTAVNLAQLVQQAAYVFVVIFGVYQITAGEMSVGGLIACTILTGRALAPMGQVASILTRYHHSMAAFSSINRIMGLPVERPEGKKFVHRQNIEGRIEFQNLTFAYQGQKVPALARVNLKINTGERVGIIGRMGSGKTTLHRLILNYYQPQEGAILIDGTDMNQIDPTELRRNMGYVPQDVQLFNGSIRENIVIGYPRASDEEVLRATRLAGLDEFVSQHPEGFDMLVGERGANLSGGQKQAIAIARSLLHDPGILLFDEPTNAMDNTTENNFLRELSSQLPGKTLILITHKTSMLQLVDRLIVINQGQVVSDGPKDEVIRALSGVTNGQ